MKEDLEGVLPYALAAFGDTRATAMKGTWIPRSDHIRKPAELLPYRWSSSAAITDSSIGCSVGEI